MSDEHPLGSFSLHLPVMPSAEMGQCLPDDCSFCWKLGRHLPMLFLLFPEYILRVQPFGSLCIYLFDQKDR